MDQQQPEWGKKCSKFFIIPQRVIVALMGCLACVTAYTTRLCISVAIVVMVVKKETDKNDISSNAICPPDADRIEQDKHIGGEYEWSEEHQGVILSSFYGGYLITHVPAGMLADAFGGKWPLGIGLLISALCCLASPLAVRHGGSEALIGIRILMGGAQGVVFPALSVLIAQWVPKKERATLGALILGGGQLGTITGNSISGILLDKYDWDITFYFFGGLGLVWFIAFSLLCYSDPSSHPFIKDSEKAYLEAEMGTMMSKKKDIPPVPWKLIFKNVPVIALIIGQIGHDWGLYVMVTDLPKYMGDVLQMSIKDNGLYSSLPYLAMWIVSILAGFLSDWLIRKEILSLTNSRKWMTSIAAFGPAIFIVAASYAGCNKLLVVALFSTAMATMGTFYAGMKLSPNDLSPNYAGSLMAISNGLGSLSGILAPYSVGVMTPNATMEEWRLVFWVAFIVLSTTNIGYIIWATGDVQDFNDPPRKEAAT